MASKNQTDGYEIRQILLMIYVGVAVAMALLTLAIALSDQDDGAAQEQVARNTPTTNPIVLTVQAEGYQTQVPVTHQGRRTSLTPGAQSTPAP